MTEQFYLHGTFNESSDSFSLEEFSFVIESRRDFIVPSFLIWFFPDTESEALLCKISKTTKPADKGMQIYVYDAIQIRLLNHGIISSIFPDTKLTLEMSSREQIDHILSESSFWHVPVDKVLLVKNVILKNNAEIIDESYFVFEETPLESELAVEVSDAIHTALDIFGMNPKDIPALQEHQILDFDLNSIFNSSDKYQSMPDGKHLFIHNGRRLYLHKVDRTNIEKCLGVDLIYNFLDEQRLVFIQYKCQRPKGKYYRSSDSSHDSEVERMQSIPTLDKCLNLKQQDIGSTRLCQCPVFIKLCKREVSATRAIPVGVYYPLCIWQFLISENKGLSVQNKPHFNNQQFQELVKQGLIGSTTSQTVVIEKHLIERANDTRLKLVFEETKSLK